MLWTTIDYALKYRLKNKKCYEAQLSIRGYLFFFHIVFAMF